METYKTYSQPTTLKTLASSLDLSISTVSRALADHYSTSLRTRERVKEMAKKMDYSPSQIARSFQARRSFIIGLIIPDLGDTFFIQVITAIQEKAMEYNYMVFIGQSNNSHEKEVKLVERMKSLGVDGMLISISKNSLNYDHFNAIRSSNIPLVFFDNLPHLSDINAVSCDMEKATRDAVDFLAAKGHFRIGMINGPSSLKSTIECKDGFFNGLKQNGLSFGQHSYIETNLAAQDIDNAANKLLKTSYGVSAVIIFNEYILFRAIGKINSLNLNPNRSVCFVGFDNLPLQSLMDKSLVASIEQNADKQGTIATEMLMEMIREKISGKQKTTIGKSIVLECALKEKHCF